MNISHDQNTTPGNNSLNYFRLCTHSHINCNNRDFVYICVCLLVITVEVLKKRSLPVCYNLFLGSYFAGAIFHQTPTHKTANLPHSTCAVVVMVVLIKILQF